VRREGVVAVVYAVELVVVVVVVVVERGCESGRKVEARGVEFVLQGQRGDVVAVVIREPKDA
jgi:hypothetical protein